MALRFTPNGRDARHVSAEDISRAREAAEYVFDAHATTSTAAWTAYRLQWLEHDDDDLMTGLALVWLEARGAADIALTAGWEMEDRAEAFCEMDCDESEGL
jgi:hypothetical protein